MLHAAKRRLDKENVTRGAGSSDSVLRRRPLARRFRFDLRRLGGTFRDDKLLESHKNSGFSPVHPAIAVS